MSEPLAHIYDLALRALDEQERQVAELRGRLTPVLAAGGVGVTLLSRPALDRGHPSGPLETAAVVVGFVALGVAALAATYLLLSGRLAFGIDAASASGLMPLSAIVDGRRFYEAMTVVLDRQRLANLPRIEALRAAFTVLVCGMLVGVCGLAVAAAVA